MIGVRLSVAWCHGSQSMSRRRATSRAAAIATLAGLLLAAWAGARGAGDRGQGCRGALESEIEAPVAASARSARQPSHARQDRARRPAVRRPAPFRRRRALLRHLSSAGEGFHGRPPAGAGLSGAPLRRNTPALWNLAWGKHFFWDGRAPSLEAQVQMPIEAAEEMGGDWPKILRRLRRGRRPRRPIPRRLPRGADRYRRPPSLEALAAYVRSLVSPPTRFDAWIDGDAQALRAAEVRGFRLFIGKAGCVLCHVGWRFTDDRFHDIGLPGRDGGPRRGAGRHAGADGLQDAEPARGRAHRALHARRLAGDARGRDRALRRRLRQRPSLSTNITAICG